MTVFCIEHLRRLPSEVNRPVREVMAAMNAMEIIEERRAERRREAAGSGVSF